jgi:sialidase-1
MRKKFLLAALVLGAGRLFAAEPVNVVSNLIAGTAEHPRNSEGSFITLKSGRILFLYSQFVGGGTDFSPCQIAQMTSDDQGRTWSEPKLLFAPEPGTMEMSVSLVRLASGRIAMFSAIKRGTMDCHPYLRISSDEGATWSAPRSILSAPGYYVLNNDRIIQTSRGRIVMPLAYHRVMGEGAGTKGHSIDLRAIDLWFYSDDEGATWTESKSWWALPVASETGLQEPGVVELADGSLVSWARTDQGRQYAMRSSDAGVTWSAPVAMAMHSPASPASIKRIPGSKDLLAVFSDYSGQFPFTFAKSTYGGRTPLVAATSSDGGVTWRTAKLLEGNPTSDYCYTAIHFVGDAVLFGYLDINASGTKNHVIRRMNLAWLTAPDDALATRARSTLHDVFAQDETWIKIHAAEALLVAGEALPMRERFLKMAQNADALPYRVGVWRVLANTSPTKAERAACVAQVERIFLNPASPDVSQALETLGKLRVRVDGPVLERVRQTLTGPSEPMRVLALWVLALRDDPAGLAGLGSLLSSPNDRMRAISAYAFRWLKTTDAKSLALLAKAADAEPAGTDTKAYLLSAAFALNADPARRSAWQSGLHEVLAKGSMDARWEASNGLLAHATAANLPHYLPLLDEAAQADSRVGAAMTILYVRARE